MKKYLFISDIHGQDQRMEEELSRIAQTETPSIVFFLGDLIGTEGLDKLQKLFYNGVYNAVKKATKENPQISDSELLVYPNNNGQTVENGVDDLWDFLIGASCSMSNKANYARELANYIHYGHFASNLPSLIRLHLQEDMEENARAWINIMTKFTNIGSKVVFVEGNWDARTPLDFYPTKECRPLPIEERSFYFKDFLKSLNDQVLYFNEVSTIETKNEIFIIWPFDSAINPPSIPEISNQEAKKIVLVSHGQIDWSAVKGNTTMTKEGETIQRNMSTIFRQLQADTAIHGHLHDRIDTNGYDHNGKLIHYLPLRTFRFIDF